MLAHEIIKRPIITEKSMLLVSNNNTYTFSVDKRANKVQIKKAIEEIFNVKVAKVNIINEKAKARRVGMHSGFRPAVTKAMVKLAEGNKIEIFTT